MKSLAFLLLAALLAGCATTPSPPQTAQLFDDRLFRPPTQRVDAADVFAVSDEMKGYLRRAFAPPTQIRSRQQGLYDALYARGGLRLEYDSATTRNAAQAFAARAGNCLSLVIMTAAFAKELGLDVRYQSVIVEDAWSRSGDLYLSVGHVNLVLARKPGDTNAGRAEATTMTIDVLPPQDIRHQRTRAIGEETIVAMYMNNRAVESLAAGAMDDAYWWAREAIRQDPKFLAAYNTLGVVYERHHDRAHAERVLKSVLAVEPANLDAIANLVTVLKEEGHPAEAAALAARLAQLQPDPPFKYYHLGLAALERGDYEAARNHFAREVDRAAYYHEFHFWLAVAQLGLGETREARRQMALALENSTTKSDHDLYAAKLAVIRNYHPQ